MNSNDGTNVAVNECAPAIKVLVVKSAWFPDRVTVANTTPESVNVIAPLGVIAADTAAVSVTAAPDADGDVCDTAKVVVVGVPVTVCIKISERFGA